MLQIMPQMRILVAVEAVGFRKGIDSPAELCRAKDCGPGARRVAGSSRCSFLLIGAVRAWNVSLQSANRAGIVFVAREEYPLSISGKEGRVMATPVRTRPPGKDPVKVDPNHYTVEFEDEKVRVLRIWCGPGEKLDITGTAGQVLHFDAFEHDPENLRDKPFEVIAVELKTFSSGLGASDDLAPPRSTSS
jgi:hypothetical protein